MQYRYYKGQAPKGRWKCIGVAQEALRLEDEDTHFATILSVNEKTDPGEALSESALYQGPFYVDLDSKKDIGKSIKAARKVVATLTGNGIPANAIQVWASGQKGFHVTVPQAVFTADKPTAKLPLVYKQMAIRLGFFNLEETDTSVYSSGKGRMWRLPGKQRDNGKYKVRISHSELAELNAAKYAEITASPRPEPAPPEVQRSSVMEALFKLAVGMAEQMQKPKTVFIDPVLKGALEDELPPCAKALTDPSKLQKGKGFNDISMQMGKAIAAFAPENAEELLSDFSVNSEGETYNTPAKRKTHCRTAFRTAVSSSSYGWSCASALSVLNYEPCMECPIAFIRVQQEDEKNDAREASRTASTKVAVQVPSKPKAKAVKAQAKAVEETPEASYSEFSEADLDCENLCDEPVETPVQEVEPSKALVTQPAQEPESEEAEAEIIDEEYASAEEPAGNQEGLLASNDGYGFMDANGRFRRVSNFTLHMEAVFVEYVPNLEREVRVAVKAKMNIGGKVVGTIFLEESHWTSKSAFIGGLRGTSNAAFYGKDDDIQKMKADLMHNLEGTTETIRRVYSCGIHRLKVNDNWIFTYVEPGWSIDNFGNENLYSLSGKVAGHPTLKPVPELKKGDRTTTEILRAMLKVNRVHIVGQIMGWTMACFVSELIFTFRNEFPLLSLHGEPGSGKTSTASLFAGLHGVDFLFGSVYPVSMPSATAFSLWTFISGTTTVPRIVEELNKSKMPRTYDQMCEYLKACWNRHAVSRGTLRTGGIHGASQTGATLTEIPLTGPVVSCSEQEITMIALVERMIQVRMTKKDKAEAQYERNFDFASGRLDKLYPFTRAAYMKAINTSPQQLREWLNEADDRVPDTLTGRPRYSFKVVFLGLRFLEELASEYELGCFEEIAEVRDGLSSYLFSNSTEIGRVKRSSEVDQIISDWNVMAAITTGEESVPWMKAGRTYLREGNTLYIDTLVAHSRYVSYVRQHKGTPVVIDNVREFNKLVSGEDYCLHVAFSHQSFGDSRPCLVLDVRELAAKGIDIAGFKETA